MASEGTDSTNNVRITTLQEEHFGDIAELLIEGFGSKRCCFCFAGTETSGEMAKRYAKYPKEKWELCAVAIDSGTGRVVGYCQSSIKGLPQYPEGLHSCKPNELYIEQVGVGAAARGKGLGTKLLQWTEDKARSMPQITFLSLGVVSGNRAIGLYERFGFVRKKTDVIEDLCTCLIIFFLMGRPFGLCDPNWGGFDMEKVLE